MAIDRFTAFCRSVAKVLAPDQIPMDPADYLADPSQFAVDMTCTPTATMQVTDGTDCSSTPAGNGSSSQSVRRLGLYAHNA